MATSKSILQRPLDLVFFIYFLIHIPTTVLLDSAILFHGYHPEAIINLLNHTWVQGYDDKLIQHGAVWFKSMIGCELLFQFPFFFAALIGLWFGKKWIRIPAIIYGTHVATTMVPILGSLWFDAMYKPRDGLCMTVLSLVYSIYLIIPLLIVFRFTFSNEDPFAEPTKASGKRD